MTRSRPIEGERTAAEAAAFARLYDLDLVEDPGDVDLYLALAGRVGGPILELGVGTGRLAVPLAAAGYDVTGVDLDPAMLARARSRAAAACSERPPQTSGRWWQVASSKTRAPCSTPPPLGS